MKDIQHHLSSTLRKKITDYAKNGKMKVNNSNGRKSSRALYGAVIIVVVVLFMICSSMNVEIKTLMQQLFNKNEDVSNVYNRYGTYDANAESNGVGYRIGHKTGMDGMTATGKGLTGGAVSETHFNPAILFQEVMAASPVVLFVRSSDLSSMELKSFLSSEYSFSPEMVVVDLDKHEHGKEVEEYIGLNKLNQRRMGKGQGNAMLHVPFLFINGVSLINNSVEENIKAAHLDGRLIETFTKVTSNKVLISEVQTPSNS